MKSLRINQEVRVQPTYRHHAYLEGKIEKIELQANKIFDTFWIRLMDDTLLKTSRHLVHSK